MKRIVVRRDFLRGAAVGAGVGLLAGGVGVKVGAFVGNGAAVKTKGFSRARSVASDTVLPKKVDVAIIGGGIVGVSTALALARRGISVAVFEKGVIAGEASGRSGGLIEAQNEAPQKLELIDYSKRLWRELKALTGEENGFLQTGSTLLFERPDFVDFAQQWVDSVKSLPNGGARMLSAKEAQSRAPGSKVNVVGGLTCETDAAAEPGLATPGIALGARKFGAKLFEFCAVRGIERTRGAVSAVITEKGRVEASSVVLAGGVWSSLMGHDLGLDIPTVQCFAKAMSLAPFDGPDFGTTSLVGERILGWRKQYDGGYIVWEFVGVAPILPKSISRFFDLRPAMEAEADALHPRFNFSTFWRWLPGHRAVPLDRPGPYEETRIYEPEQDTFAIDSGFTHLQQAMPVFENGPVRERWTGAMQMTVDNMPIISTVDSIPGLVIGTGFLYGLTMGPGAGAVLADLATGAKPAIDIKLFRHSRFTDGSKLQFYA